jgi:iron(III) transport system ATP-binding protein
MVFQDLALWPHMTALETVAFALAGGGGAREARRARARETLAAVGLPEGLDRRPDTLSGGERQRLAFARAIAPSPRTLLLDEPFTGLHPQVREDLAGLTRRWVRETPGRAVLLVTHLADEALALADHAAVMGAGRCEQSGPPEALLARPASESAAYLLGYSTCLPAARCADNGWVETPLGRLDCPEAASSDRCRLAFRPGDFAARPEGRYSGTVVDTGVKNGVPACRVRAGDALLWVTGGGPARPGDAIRFDLAGRPAVLPAEDKEARS